MSDTLSGRLGKILIETPRNTGAMGIGKSVLDGDEGTKTLKELGISRDLSSRAQAIASIPEDVFEQTLAEPAEVLRRNGL